MSAVLAEATPIRRAVIDGAVHLPVNLVARSKTNPRKTFDQKAMDELTESVRKHGVLQPILVRDIAGAKKGQPLYEIVAGERRWRASLQADQATVPAIVKQMTDFEVLELQVIENLQREDLHPLEEAEGYQALMRKPDGIQGFATVEELAARIHKSRSYVFGRLKLCALIESAKKAFADGKIIASTALLVARMPAAVQAEATTAIVRGFGGEPMSYRSARDYLEQHFMLKLGSAPFKITDETLHPEAGSCNACGKRTGANPDLFDDIKSGDVCTDAPCFAKKKELHQARVIALAKADGRQVILGAEAKKLQGAYGSGFKGFLSLAEVDYSIHGTKSIGTLLGKDAPQSVLIEDPRTKDLVEAVPRDSAMRVLKDKGVVKVKTKVPKTAAELKRAAESKVDSDWRMAVAKQAIAASLNKKFDLVAKLRDFLMVEAALIMWANTQESEVVEKLLGWSHIDDGYGHGPGMKKIAERFRKLTAAQLDQAVVALLVAEDIEYGSPDTLVRVATQLGVKPDKIKAELVAEAKATAKKPAAKKATPAKKVKGVKRAAPAAKKLAAKKPAPAKKAAPKAAARPVKYSNPSTGETWSGKGLQPAWVKAAIKSGKALDDFAKLAESAPIAVKNGTTLTPAAAWPFPTGAK